MSFRAAARNLYRLGIEAATRFGLIKTQWGPLRGALRTALRQTNLRYSRNVFIRVLQQTIRRGYVFRPFSATLHFRPRIPDIHHGANRNFHRLMRRGQQKWPFLDHVQHVFSTNQRYNAALVSDKMPTTLDGYDIGSWIACGCNAAVYALRVKDQKPPNKDTSYPLALKIMFNYDFSLPERYIWRDMKCELIPLIDQPKELDGKMGFRPIKRSHPNIIKMHTAFIDRFPNIEGSEKLFPEALPSADVFGSLISDPKTLFIVMKRYRMTLREYVLTHKRNYWTGRVMLGQLLEALVFLYENTISHRDMKSDNVLLNFDDDCDIPHLVLSDFGCAQTTSFILPYENEFTNLGGNLSLRSPEIRRAQPGAILDYGLADLWASGTLAYEIFTRSNPFYSKMSSATYMEDELPELPSRLHSAVKSMVYRTLRIESAERPSPHVAANVVCLSLFRFGAELKTIMNECGIIMELYASNMKFATSRLISDIRGHLDKKMDELVGLYAAETISSRLITPTIISKSELQLRATFLSRVNRDQIWQALEYFVEENVSCGNSSISSSTLGAPIYYN